MVRLGAMGDVLRTLPAVCALREAYPDAKISWLVESRCAGVVALCPAVDEIRLFPREEWARLLRGGRVLDFLSSLKALTKELRAANFQMVLDFHGLLKSGFLMRLTGAPLRIGYAHPHAREYSWLFSNQRVKLPKQKESRFDRNQALVTHLGIDLTCSGPLIEVPEPAKLRLSPFVTEGRGPVLFHPGASEVASHKRWSPQRFSSLARRVMTLTGTPCLVLSGPSAEEHELQRQIVEGSGGAAAAAPPTPTLADLAALLSAGSLFVGADSGPLHMASLLGTPVLQLLGPTDPVQNEPWSATPWHRAYVPQACSPCRQGCADVHCMEALSVDLVWDCLKRLGKENASWIEGEALNEVRK
ncbi:MAG: hypothetical protein CL917_00830 [Deltaproteobacteria bacterium]|nr:hypothetical protein [Deltaproteobacteria bacterium]